MSSIKNNLIANYLGQGWVALMGLAFIPLYIRYLGMEAYGLIGLFAVIQAWMTLLDMGMTPTLNREMARYTAGAHSSQSIRDLLRSLEILCFSAGRHRLPAGCGPVRIGLRTTGSKSINFPPLSCPRRFL